MALWIVAHAMEGYEEEFGEREWGDLASTIAMLLSVEDHHAYWELPECMIAGQDAWGRPLTSRRGADGQMFYISRGSNGLDDGGRNGDIVLDTSLFTVDPTPSRPVPRSIEQLCRTSVWSFLLPGGVFWCLHRRATVRSLGCSAAVTLLVVGGTGAGGERMPHLVFLGLWIMLTVGLEWGVDELTRVWRHEGLRAQLSLNRCAVCRYDMRGLECRVCPECGTMQPRSADSVDLDAYLGRRRERRKPRRGESSGLSGGASMDGC